jgi:hypothetical protein
LTLRPFSTAEIFGSGPRLLLDAIVMAPQDLMPLPPPPRSYERDEAIELIIRGDSPEMREMADRDRGGRYTSYIDSIIERDMSAIHAVRKPDALLDVPSCGKQRSDCAIAPA